MRPISTLLVIILIMSSTLVVGQSITADQKTAIDEIFQTWNKDGSPGAAIGVVKDGELVYTQGYGLADLEHDVAMDQTTVFYAASVSKQFVTMTILLLEEMGKLSLDDEIQKYLTDFPQYDDPLTIRHFIHHTSGVRDHLSLWELAGNSVMDHIDEDAIYDLIKRQKSLNFTPGERYLYSNSCYFMLSMVVKEVSGLSIKDFAEKHMFGPLGMKNTHFHDDVSHIVKNRAFSYAPADGGYSNLIMRFDLVGSGGLYTTVEDLFLWDQNFYNNKLGKGTQDLINKMHEDGKLNNGESAGYAFGVTNGTYKGLKTVSHGGALAGYRTYLLRFPEQNFSVIVLANISNFNPGARSRDIADIMLEGQFQEEPAEEQQGNEGKKKEKKIKYVKTNTAQLEKSTGTFILPNGVSVDISIDQDSLHILQTWNNVEYNVAATSKSTYMIPGNAGIIFEFTDESDDIFNTLVVDQSGQKMTLKRREDNAMSNIQEYVGKYYADELDVVYELYAEKEKLYCRVRFNEPEELAYIESDRFNTQGVTFNFIREEGKVSSFRIEAGRVQNIVFVKQ